MTMGFDSDDDDRELLGAMVGLIDGDDDHELLGDMDCLDDNGLDSDVDDRGLLEVMDGLIDGHGLVLTLCSDLLELSWLLLLDIVFDVCKHGKLEIPAYCLVQTQSYIWWAVCRSSQASFRLTVPWLIRLK